VDLGPEPVSAVKFPFMGLAICTLFIMPFILFLIPQGLGYLSKNGAYPRCNGFLFQNLSKIFN